MELTFADGTPFAAAETVKFLGEAVAATGKDVPASGDGEGGDERLAEAVRTARKQAGKGKLANAIALLQEGIAQTGNKRGQFLWRLELARICLGAGKMQLAIPQLEHLSNQIEEHHLEQWEPHLCREVYSTLYLAQQRLAKVARNQLPELTEKMRKLHAQLSRLDPAAALEIDAKN
jgi:type VI secretion system protein VasJ